MHHQMRKIHIRISWMPSYIKRLIHIGDFFKREASNFQWILVYSLVLFTLAVFQRFSEARKKSLTFKRVLYLFKQVIFVNKQTKYKNRLGK